jgi:SAM-dependent methyltransferase
MKNIERLHTTSPAGEKRFEFGRNWRAFLMTVDEPHIGLAEKSLAELLRMESLQGRRFLDVGCSSGLSSLAALRLGAEVLSFDFYVQSVATTRALKERFAPGESAWRIEQGSVLDANYLAGLGQWDIVYSWGVLHHTGALWLALEGLLQSVVQNGLLAIAIYNDEGLPSHLWRVVKRSYVSVPPLRPVLLTLSAAILWGPSLFRDFRKGRLTGWLTSYRNQRAMSRWHDLVDWVGGYPFEVATPEQIAAFCELRGYRLEQLIPTQRLGCNQFCFRKMSAGCHSLVR